MIVNLLVTSKDRIWIFDDGCPFHLLAMVKELLESDTGNNMSLPSAFPKLLSPMEILRISVSIFYWQIFEGMTQTYLLPLCSPPQTEGVSPYQPHLPEGYE